MTAPNWDTIDARAAAVIGDPGFAEAAQHFARRVTACFARPGPVARVIHDGGSYAVLAILVAATSNGGDGYVATRRIVTMLAPQGWASQRRITRLIAQAADRGLLVARHQPGDARIREIAASAAVLDFFAAWHDAHLAPLAQLDATSRHGHRTSGDAHSAAVWKTIVVAMKDQHGLVLVDPFPAIAALMRRSRGYLAMLALRLDPMVTARRIAQQFGISETQARITLRMARTLDPACANRWIATELAFAGLVAERCGPA